MGNRVSRGVGRPRPTVGQARLFTTRCNGCPVNTLCSERDSLDACGDPAEYRPEALHPDRGHFAPGDLAKYRFPLPPTRWTADRPELPLVLPVAHDGTREFPCAASLNAEGALALAGRTIARTACLCTKDTTLERIWRVRSKLGGRLHRAGVELVIAPGFSSWWQDPPFERLHEMVRTAEVAVRLAKAVPTAPAIVWRTQTDLMRWIDWLLPTVPAAIVVDASTLRRPEEWNWFISGLRTIAHEFADRGQTPRLISVGPSALPKLHDLASVWPNALTVASKAVWQLSRARRFMGTQGSREVDLDSEFEGLLAFNISRMEDALRAGASMPNRLSA